MLTPHQRPQRYCRREPVHGPSSFPLVTAKIDKVAGIDYSLLAPPTATTETLDGQLKVSLTPATIYPHSCGSPSSWETNRTKTPPLPLCSQPPCIRISLLRHLGLLSLLEHTQPTPSPAPETPPPPALPSFLQVSTQISPLPGDAFSDHCHENSSFLLPPICLIFLSSICY